MNRGWRFMPNAVAGSNETTGQEWMMAAQHLIQNHSKRENVCAFVRKFFQQNFGRHIGGCPSHGAGAVRRGALVGARKVFCNDKVQNLHLALGSQHDALGITVAMTGYYS